MEVPATDAPGYPRLLNENMRGRARAFTIPATTSTNPLMPKETPNEKIEAAKAGVTACASPFSEAATPSELPCNSVPALSDTKALRVGFARTTSDRGEGELH